MIIDTRDMVSLTEANQNFSRIARLADERGSVVILRNNVPRYVLLDYSQIAAETTSDEDVLAAGSRFIHQHRGAFEELAK